MFDILTNMWQAVQVFLMGTFETVAHFAMENPFMAVVVVVYMVGFAIAVTVVHRKVNS